MYSAVECVGGGRSGPRRPTVDAFSAPLPRLRAINRTNSSRFSTCGAGPADGQRVVLGLELG